MLESAHVPRIEAEPGRAIEVELGAAEAHFLIDRAVADPETLFGGEIRRDLIEVATAGFMQAGVDNFRCVFANMSVDMPACSPGQRASLLSQLSRSLVQEPAAQAAGDRPGAHRRDPPRAGPAGQLYVMTDIFTLALEAMAAL